jgi:sugar lactone lactonase YvrE
MEATGVVRNPCAIIVAAAVAAGVVSGCRSTPEPETAPLFFPAPPAQPRVQFLTWASGADQVEPSRGSLEEFILGEEPLVLRLINKPYGVAARDGVVYVCDTKGLCVCRLDFAKQAYSTVGSRGPGRLRKPINIVIDPLGYKFVADPVRKQVVVFGPDEQYVTALDVPEPCHPVDVAIHGEELYVLDNDETCQIVVLDRRSGEVLRTIGEPGGEPGQFKIPNSICVDAEGCLYVSDTHNWRIQKLTSTGEPVWVKGGPGYTLGQFGRPRGIRTGPDGIVYLVDGATEIVQMFDSEGQILMRFGGPGNTPGALGLPSSLAIDTTSLPYFEKYVHKDFNVDYLLFVASQYGGHLVSVYAFGSFPEGYRLAESEIATLPAVPPDQGIGPAVPVVPQPEAREAEREEESPEDSS